MRTRLVKTISQTATTIFGDILGDHSPVLDWGNDYGITLTQGGETRVFRQLSGGEQMAAAISLRLALLTHMSQVRFVILDEPTTNLDDLRRGSLADKLRNLQNLEQLFIISHDDTFGQDGVHQVEIAKIGGTSRVLS
jgi:exonuclease SbcC